MEINEKKLYQWLSVDKLPLNKILSLKEYKIITMLHGINDTQRFSLKEVSSSLKMDEDKIMDIHTEALLKIWGYKMREII